jgi:hypothetical protein
MQQSVRSLSLRDACAPRLNGRLGHRAPTMLLSLLILAAPSLLPAQIAPPTAAVPTTYQSLYTSLTTPINAFGAEVNAGWNKSTTGPVEFAAELFTANSENGSQMLNATYMAQAVIPELNELKAMGVKAVYVAIDFPVLYGGYYTYENTAGYSAYWSFYGQVTTAIRARGLKMIVETNALLTSSGFGSNWNAGPYFASLTQTQYQTGRATQAAAIAANLKPDFLSVLNEPDTEAVQSGFSSIGTVSGGTAMLNQILTAVEQTGAAGVMVGAGTGSWMPSYQSWFQSFAGTGIQYIDVHVFPVTGTYLTQLPAMAAYAATLSKPFAVSQCWVAKETASQVGIASYSQAAALDPFSFWAPLDTGFLQSMVNFAYWKQLLFLSPFWSDYFHTYLPYNATNSAMPGSQLLALAESTAGQAISTAQYTSTAEAYGSAISHPADVTPPSVPTGLAAPENYTAVNLTWTPSTDNVGVAGYNVYRNGVQLGTTSQTTWYDPGLKTSTTYIYTVSAYDGAMNTSAKSVPFMITMLN